MILVRKPKWKTFTTASDKNNFRIERSSEKESKQKLQNLLLLSYGKDDKRKFHNKMIALKDDEPMFEDWQANLVLYANEKFNYKKTLALIIPSVPDGTN